MASEWSEKLIMRNDGWEIDGVGKHTYNLELACKLMGEAEEEAPLLPYFPHFRRLLRRAESFLLPSPCPVYTLAISYTEGPRRIKATFWGDRAGAGRDSQSSAQGRKKMAGPFLAGPRAHTGIGEIKIYNLPPGKDAVPGSGTRYRRGRGEWTLGGGGPGDCAGSDTLRTNV